MSSKNSKSNAHIVAEESFTYEATKARQSTQRQPDRIHWDGSSAFRDNPYRQLHHQRGCIGLFRVRLLEAAELQRSYWSALALGPVKHLGLSKAHGAVSSFCSFSLDFEEPNSEMSNASTRRRPGTATGRDDLDRKPAAKATKRPFECVKSPVVPTDNNPVWENCQFEFPFRKGAMPADGMRVVLRLRVEEDSTAFDNFLSGDERLLGAGTLDLTDLCLGETATGQTLPGVLDAWITLSLDNEEIPDIFDDRTYGKNDPLASPCIKKEHPNFPKPPPVTGKVRILVSYQPNGLEPQPKDVVALECFARRPSASSTCRPIIPPLMPLTVMDRRGSYLLCEYFLPGNNSNQNPNGSATFVNNKACIRLHRNAVFVLERKNLMDAAQNLALLPLDVMVATPLGQTTMHVLGPVVAAGRELLMPALLSLKLVWVAARTATLASLSGVQAVGSTMWHEGSSSLTASHRSSSESFLAESNAAVASTTGSGRDGRQMQRQRDFGATQFVSL